MNDALQTARSQQPLRLLAAVLLLGVLPPMLLQLATGVGWIAPDVGDAWRSAWAMAAFTATAAAMLAMALVLPPDVGWRPLPARAVLVTYLPFLVAWVLFVIGYLRAAHALGHPVLPQQQLRDLAAHGTALPGLWIVSIGIVLAAPVLEEIVFRGYLLGTLLLWLPSWLAQLLTAAAFGWLHGPDYALPIGVLGLFFGWLRARHRSLLPSMLAHAVHNGITLAITLAWPESLHLMYPQ